MAHQRASCAAVLAASALPSCAYKAAYVEHKAISPCGQGACGSQTLQQNAAAYSNFAKSAAAQGAQIIVFPEYGLTGFSSYPANQWGDYAENIPVVKGKQVPCDSGSFSSTFKTLSCAAKQNNIAIVANMADYPGGNKLYNTDIVFDTDGTYLAKYHKQNLWGESNMAVPSDCPEVSFTTSFGVTFGVITCADLIYKFPAGTLASKGIKDFVMPAAWDNSMAQMQVMGYAQGWSLVNKVNLILSNHRTSSESGSGIFVSGKPVSYYYYPGNSDGDLKVADVSAAAAAQLPPAVPVGAAPARNGTLQLSPSAGWSFAQLSAGKACSGTALCCTATYTGSASGYVIAAMDGTDTNDGMTWSAQVCAVLACRSPGQGCLSYQTGGGSLTGLTLSATGMSPSTSVPEVIATSGDYPQLLLTPGDATNGITFSGGASPSLQVKTSYTLTSAVVYGRKFAGDNLPYSC